ncbi:MAG: phosphotransferase [Candidatus Rokubacteria bacterium]|nr:phosphotransferase [Candidatus Rokubacteria bacterium]
MVIKAVRDALAPVFFPAAAANARYHALQPSDGPAGRYRLSTSQGEWFVRVTTRQGRSALEKTLTDFLAERGVSVNPLVLAGRSLLWEGREYFIDVRPFIDGRHFNGSSEDLRRLAGTLSACHRALAAFPKAEEIRLAAKDRAARHEAIRMSIAESVERGRFDVFAELAVWATGHREWLVEMAARFNPSFDEMPGAQCVHGEIHEGNALFRNRDGAAVLVDFEESIHLFAPPAWDLAFLVQRFCLRDQPALPEARRRVALVAEGYGQPLPGLATMMRQAAWFTMATILDLRARHGIATPEDECGKFVRLERQALAYAEVL